MPLPTDTARHLRHRAQVLRGLAGTVAAARVRTLYRGAGPDTWLGPTASRCLDDLTPLGERLRRCSDDLHGRARRLERMADELDLAAAVAGPR